MGRTRITDRKVCRECPLDLPIEASRRQEWRVLKNEEVKMIGRAKQRSSASGLSFVWRHCAAAGRSCVTSTPRNVDLGYQIHIRFWAEENHIKTLTVLPGHRTFCMHTNLRPAVRRSYIYRKPNGAPQKCRWFILKANRIFNLEGVIPLCGRIIYLL